MLAGNRSNDKIKFDTMVICSTMNQMVNYVAIMKHGIKKVYNITLASLNNKKGNITFDYNQWDKNLKAVLEHYEIEVVDINLSTYELAYHDNIIQGLEKGNIIEKNILWHISGGQRHISMAINQYVNTIRTNDVLVYFEGNKERFYYYKSSNPFNRKQVEVVNEIDITINLALRLMGCDIKVEEVCKKQSNYCKAEDRVKENKALDFYDKLCQEFCSNSELQQIFIDSNTYEIRENGKTKLERLIDELRNSRGLKIEPIIMQKQLLSDHRDHSNGKVFGYIFEHMFFYRLLKEVYKFCKNQQIVADVGMNIKIKDDTKSGIIDEFDVLLVTKWGKVIAFECKSGGMTGDNAKSHNYSSYKIAGVYGTPYLICPLDEEAIGLGKYEHIKKARKSATRANLRIYELSNIQHLVEEIMNNSQYR